MKAIIKHSDKDVATDDSLSELLKDVDSLNRYLHGVPKARTSKVARQPNCCP